MLSPSHPGPHKATHLSMRDRTLLDELNNAGSTDQGADNRAFIFACVPFSPLVLIFARYCFWQ